MSDRHGGKSDIVVVDGQEFVETEDARFALGLQLPEVRTMVYPSLATLTPSLSFDQIKEIIAADDWEFGGRWFDSSWITNQNGYGSCAAYGASSALAKARVLGGQDRVDLSGDYLYSLVNGGRDRGSLLSSNMRAIMNKGVCRREVVDLGEIYRRKYDTAKADRDALRFRAAECYATPDEQSICTALALKMPVVIAIHVGRNWRRFDSNDVLAPAPGPGNHCEHLDDIRYSRERGRFEFRKATSHGKSYSGDGYCWTTWDDHYKSTSRYHQFYAVPSAIEDPQGVNPDSGEEAEPLSTPKLLITTADSCVWCRRWKETEEPKARAAGYEIKQATVPGDGVPRFQLIVDDQWKRKIGFWKFEDIERTAAEMYAAAARG